MNKLIYTSFLLFLSISALGQRLAKKSLIEDLVFLNEAIKNGHPVNYQKSQKVQFDSLIHAVETNYPDSISWRVYEATVRKAVWQIGCVHTSVNRSPIRRKDVASGLFPLDVFAHGNKLFLLEEPGDSSKLRKGSEILSINGIPDSVIIADLMKFKSPDGRSNSFGYEIMNRNFPALFSIYYEPTVFFEISFRCNGELLTEKIKGKDKSILKVKGMETKPAALKVLFKDEKALFGILPGNIAYLRIESFNKKCKPFYKDVFKYLQHNTAKNLVIDLRDNLGGSRTNVEILLSYLIGKKTSYQIIRPKNNLGKYLTGTGKMKFLASYLYFDLGNLFHRKKLEDGVAVTYKIKPKEHVFEGSIYVLVNGYSASSSTVTAAYLKHHQKAVLIGQQTAGGEFMNNGGSFPDLVLPKSRIEIKTAAYRFNYDFQGVGQSGIIPDHVIEYNAENYMKTDLEIQKVIELIGK